MDPIRALLDRLIALLPQNLRNPELEALFDRQVQEFFSRFELVPKQEFEAQQQILTTLEAQVSQLEARLAKLES